MPKISSPSMLVWQLERLMGQLMLVGDHYADSTCPCTFGFTDPSGTYVGENCIPKHLLSIYEYATETHPMTGDEKLKEILLTIADEARQIRELEKRKLCLEEVEQHDITNWSRDKRKLLEPFIYDMACKIPKPAPEDTEEDLVAPVPPQTEGEVTTLEQLQEYPVCMGLEKARDIHEHYLGLPPDPKTGSIEWHKGWVDLYSRALQTCGCRGKETVLENPGEGWKFDPGAIPGEVSYYYQDRIGIIERENDLGQIVENEVIDLEEDKPLRSFSILEEALAFGKQYYDDLKLPPTPPVPAYEICERISPKYYGLVSWFNVPFPDYQFSLEPEVKERKIDEALKKLAAGIEDIQNGDNFREFLITMGKFHNYSLGNQILIMLQHRGAEHVAGYNTWKQLGRIVRQGEHGIMILAPCFPPKPKKEAPKEIEGGTEEEAEAEEEELQPIYFKVVYVFDISQTEGKPLPEVAVPVLTGEVNETLFASAKQLVGSQGLRLDMEPRPDQDPGIKGMFAGDFIWVKPDEPEAQQLKTLLHELAHYFSENVFGIPRQDAEVIAEGCAYAVGSHFGFDSGVRSFPYVAIWAKERKVLERNMQNIRSVVGKMLGLLEPAEVAAPTPPDPEGRMKSPYDFPLSQEEVNMAETRSMAPTPPPKKHSNGIKQIIGYYNELEYRVTLLIDGDPQEDLYTAGNSPYDSQQSVSAEDGVGLETMKIFCERTSKEMAREEEAKFLGVEYEEIPELEESPTPPALSADEKAIPGFGEKFEHCVLDTKAKGGAVNPYAVCRAGLRRSHGLPVGKK